MKKILHILPCLELGGTETFVMNHYRYIDRTEFQFDFLVFSKKDYPYIKEIERLGGRVFFASQPSLLHFLKFYRWFKQVIQEGGPYTAIHCHANVGNAIPLLCGFLCNIRIRISHSHAVNQMPCNVLRKLIFRGRKVLIRLFATQFLACSIDAGRSLYGDNFSEKKIKIICNGIEVDRFAQCDPEKVEKLKQTFGISEKNDLIVGNISRFDSNKNQLFILDVFKVLLEKHPNAILLLGGVDGGMLHDVQDHVKLSEIEDHVRFLGKRQDIAECLKLIDVYLFPSQHEGLGIALLEAQASGCLCVASTGVPSVSNLEFGTAFYLELSRGAEYWANYIDKKLITRIRPTNEEIREAFVKKRFDVEESLKELVKCYE